MDDHTWKIIDTSGDDGKVVFKVIEGTDKYRNYAEKDDFGKIKNYTHFAGCEYKMQVENRTKYKVKIGSFFIMQNDRKMFDRHARVDYFVNAVLEPGEKKSKVGRHPLLATTDLKTKEPATSSELTTLFKRYGCKAQSGSKLFFKGTSKTVIFSPASGISGAAVKPFVKISPGVYPLQEKIHW